MTSGVIITGMICVTVIALALIGRKSSKGTR